MDLSELRQEYTKYGLRRQNLDSSPFAQFERWFKQAVETKAPEPNAMNLATVSPDGRPRLRTVLLKAFDERGFVFYTNFESVKAQHLALNHAVALSFLWIDLERQVTIEGRAERISTAEALKYFITRPMGSQLGAWASPQSKIITSRKLLEMKVEEMKRKFADGQIPLPSFWGGFRVKPDAFEFWQGRPSRLHDRFLYTLQPDASWKIERLAP